MPQNAPLFVRDATLPDGRAGIDLLAEGGRITALAPALPVPPGAQVIDFTAPGPQVFVATVGPHGLRYNRFQYIPVRGLAPS